MREEMAANGRLDTSQPPVILAAPEDEMTPRKYYNTRNRPEWPLVKASIIAGSSFPVAAAVGDFDEASARLVEQRIGFGPVFDRAGFAAIGSEGNQVAGEVEQQVFP